MKNLLIISLALVFICDVHAQSGRGAPASRDKANQRTTQPTPTPLPKPPEITAALDEQPSDTSDGDVVKVDTKLVTIPVRILDRKGRFVGGLAKENFKVFEDGVEQEIAYFTNEEQPFTVALVLDMSYSTNFKISEIQSAAIAFIDQLRPQDKVMVVSFDQDVHILCEATNDRQRIYRAIRSTKIQTGTSLYEAVDIVINDRLKRVQGRKAVILFTDGVDTTSTRSNDLENLHDALELDALVYPIRYDTYADVQAMKNKGVILKPGGTGPGGVGFPMPVPTVGSPSSRGTSEEDYRRAKEYLEQLATRTGGTIYEANTMGNLNNAFTRIASELREYYSLGFYPKDIQEGKQRKLKVKVDKPDLAVRAKDSYIVAKLKKRKYS
jgi:Ca-activated chloride channel family protein